MWTYLNCSVFRRAGPPQHAARGLGSGSFGFKFLIIMHQGVVCVTRHVWKVHEGLYHLRTLHSWVICFSEWKFIKAQAVIVTFAHSLLRASNTLHLVCIFLQSAHLRVAWTRDGFKSAAPLGVITYFVYSPHKINFIQRWKFLQKTNWSTSRDYTGWMQPFEFCVTERLFALILAGTIVALWR